MRGTVKPNALKLLALILLLMFLPGCADKPLATHMARPEVEPVADVLVRARHIGGFNADSMLTAVESIRVRIPDLTVEHEAALAIVSGISQNQKGSYHLAVRDLERARKIMPPSAPDSLVAILHTSLGHANKNRGEYPSAQQHFLTAIELFDKAGLNTEVSRQYANLGELFMLKGDTQLAIENLNMALESLQSDKSNAAYLKAAHTLANVYGMSGDYGKAMELDEMGLRIADSLGTDLAKTPFLDNKANCFLYSGKLDSAEVYFKKCLTLDKKYGNPKQIADTYSNLGALYTAKGNIVAAREWFDKSIGLLEKIGHKRSLAKTYELLRDAHVKAGDYKSALAAQQQKEKYYQQLVDERKEAALSEFRVVHETEQKEKELAQNRLELLEKDAQVQQRNSIIVIVLLAAVFAAIIGRTLWVQQRIRQKQMEQQHELRLAMGKIEQQNELQNQRLAISRDLHDNIGAQLTFIISSVDNLKYRFDVGDTPLGQKLSGITNFARDTIVELRDTIWAMNNNNLGFEDLRGRILNFVEKARESHESINFQVYIDSSLEEGRMSSVTGMNVYRCIQEAVNNALKHSGATSITIDVERDANLVSIAITDNGSGYDAATSRGNGLINIDKRMSEIDGAFAILTNESGTKVTLQVPNDKITFAA